MDIGSNLYALRRNAGYDAKTLAELVGISKSYVHKLEKSQSDPGLPILQRWVACTRPDPNAPGYQAHMTEKWAKISLSFLFEDGFLDDSETAEIPIAEQELVVRSLPTAITRFLPTHFLHAVFTTIFGKSK